MFHGCGGHLIFHACLMNLAQSFLSFVHARKVVLLQGVVLLEVLLHLCTPKLWEGKVWGVRARGVATQWKHLL
jgi:hypothetical protein